MPNYILTGHVDHGKSTLCGRLLVNYTEQDKHYLEKLRQTSPNNWLGQKKRLRFFAEPDALNIRYL